MGLPRSQEARLYYRAAYQRYEDAEFLLAEGRTTGAVYLAGYGIECILKALILSRVPNQRRTALLRLFTGRRAHEFEWLKQQYTKYGRGEVPKEIARHFAMVNTWSTDIRYVAGSLKKREAEAFCAAAAAIIHWADGRL